MSEYKYIIYRRFTAEERPDPRERHSYFGWSDRKKVIEAFKQQRAEKKYKIIKVHNDDLGKYRLTDYIDDTESMLDFVKLRFANSRDEFMFLTTLRELREAEKKIQTMARERCTLDVVKKHEDYMKLINMFINLKEYYAEAVDFLGFRPTDLQDVFQSIYEDSPGSLATIENQIEDAYDGMIVHPAEGPDRYLDVPGLIMIEDVASKLNYSVENFVSVLRDDL